jgi:DNA-binding HxlR family transcriptional regulator
MIYKGNEVTIEIEGKTFHCALDITMHYLGGKWKSIVLYYLLEGPQRFTQFRKLMPDISERVLSQQLKELEADGLIHREVFAAVPPKVEYSLTPFGIQTKAILQAMGEFGQHIGKSRGKLITKEPVKETVIG